MQHCGICSVLADLFRRIMCLGGSRRGSGDSYYEELEEDEVRRGGISVDRTDQNAIFIRMVGKLKAFKQCRCINAALFFYFHHSEERWQCTSQGYLKSQVYRDRPTSLAVIKDNIQRQFLSIPTHMLYSAVHNIEPQLQVFLMNDGRYAEHVL
ncbi:uncharacterized protein [Anabrus simplex]|uniref:uncharacterized protein n=1 Tax=Anabrus simplex TaxID=316456 RepID=UPI0035A31061